MNAIGHRITRIKKQLKIDDKVIAYSYRHTYITKSLINGVDVATVAELAGTSVQMIEQHYGHVASHNTHMSNMAAKSVNRAT